nr:MAG TPA: hypothetical protein [Caudoviricetes sp.]
MLLIIYYKWYLYCYKNKEIDNNYNICYYNIVPNKRVLVFFLSSKKYSSYHVIGLYGFESLGRITAR